MNWKVKRLIGTALWAVCPYAGFAFVSWDYLEPFSSLENRGLLLVLTALSAGTAFTYPGWSWGDDQ